jgi:hypothetical protein
VKVPRPTYRLIVLSLSRQEHGPQADEAHQPRVRFNPFHQPFPFLPLLLTWRFLSFACLSSRSYNDEERESYKEIIFSNTVQSMRLVFLASFDSRDLVRKLTQTSFACRFPRSPTRIISPESWSTPSQRWESLLATQRTSPTSKPSWPLPIRSRATFFPLVSPPPARCSGLMPASRPST